jgi:hypothetical protein
MNDEHVNASELPGDVADMAAALDALASRDASGRAGLEDRLYMATRGSLPQERPAGLRLSGSPASMGAGRRSLVRMTPMRLAAAVALGGGVLAVWLATMTGSGVPGQQFAGAGTGDEMEYNLVLAALDDPWFASPDLDFLRLEADAMAESLSWDWPLNTEGAL